MSGDNLDLQKVAGFALVGTLDGDTNPALKEQKRAVRLDPVTHSVLTMGYFDHEIWAGESYYVNASTLVGVGGKLTVYLKTPDSPKLMNLEIFFESALAATVRTWRGAGPVFVPANRLPPLNRFHDSPNTSAASICHTPATAFTQNPINKVYIGSTSVSGRSDAGGPVSGRKGFIISRNAEYQFELESSAADNSLSIWLDWFEHEPEY